MLDERLKLCAELVSGKGIAVDVGTDHALLASELIRSGKCQNVIASDIKEGPLEAARKTIEKYEIADKVELILSDGLENVPLEGVTDIVIAGMGGETIADIIGKAQIDPDEKIRMILQPMTKPEILRKRLYDYHMEIKSEYIVQDGEKMYVIMVAEGADEWRILTEAESIYGFFDDNDEKAIKYHRKEAERLAKIAESLDKAGKKNESEHYYSLSKKMTDGFSIASINEIYNYLDELYPFSLQEKWDNSGLIVEGSTPMCQKVMLCLDITKDVIYEAIEKQAGLVISHHPVIFNGVKRLTYRDPVFLLAESNISAICAHTNLDIANGGTNGVIVEILKENFEVILVEPFEEVNNELSLGKIITIKEGVNVSNLAEKLKEIFNCKYVRYSKSGKKVLSKIAVCSGSGGSMLDIAVEKGCDAFITGDIKHDVWISSNNQRITVFDFGHFATENIVLNELRRVLEKKFPCLDIEISDASEDPCLYV